MLSKFDNIFTAWNRSLFYNVRFGSRFHHHELYFNPGSLTWLESLIATHKLLLVVKSFSDDTDEKLYEEHANYDYHDHGIKDHKNVVVFNRLLVGTDCVYRAPHDISPTFRGLNSDQSQHTCHNIIVVEIWLNPFTAVVDAVPHRADVANLLLHTQI